MVHNQRYQVLRKHQVVRKGGGEDKESQSTTTLVLKIGNSFKRTSRPKLLSILLLSLLSFSIISAPHLFTSLIGVEIEDRVSGVDHVNVPMCSSASNGTICCDRSSTRSDICFMKGDIRTQPTLNSLFLYTNNVTEPQHENIRPYTRKWETNVMKTTVTQLHLVSKTHHNDDHECDVSHDAPALVFSTGGYTGNVYHEFNDGIVPLYITSRHLDKKVVLVVVDYHDWWVTKYEDVLSRLSDRPPVDFHGDGRTHCFPEAIVGLRIHGELAVNSSLTTEGNKTIADFKNLLEEAYRPRIRFLNQESRTRQFKNKKQEPDPRTRASSVQEARTRLESRKQEPDSRTRVQESRTRLKNEDKKQEPDPRTRASTRESRTRQFKNNKKQEPDSRTRTGAPIQESRARLEDKKQEPDPRIRTRTSSTQESRNRAPIQEPRTRLRNERPRLVFVSRNGSRALLNENSLVKMAERIGFGVQVLRPGPETELAKIYRALNASDAMVGVHGAAMTHFLFMRPGTVFIQIIPLGTVWAAETYYGEPAVKLGLKYSGYKIALRESSLYDMYEKDDIVLREPESVTKKGWEVTKKIYLDRQNVRLDLGRFRKSLVRAYRYSISKMHQ